MNFSSLFQQRILSIASTGFAVVLARILSFGLFVFSARKMSAEDNAGLIYIVGMSQLIVQLGSLGWLNLIRRMAAALDDMPPALAKGFVRRSLQIPALFIIVTVLGIYAIGGTGIFSDSLSQTLQYSSLIAILMLPNAVLREYLAGLNRPTASVFFSDTLPLALTVLSMWLFNAFTIKTAAICLAAAFAASGAAQTVIVRPQIRAILTDCSPRFQTPAWLRTAGYSVIGFGGKLLMDRMDTIFLAPIAGLTSLAYYNSAVRLTGLILLVPVILIPVFSPRVNKAFRAGDKQQLRYEVLIQIVIIVSAIVPAALILLLSPSAILGALFGTQYSTAGDIVWIILIAQSLFALSLPFSNLLLMTDGEVSYAIASVLALIATYTAAALLIPDHRIYGAALAMLAGSSILAFGIFIAGIRRMYDFSGDVPAVS